MGVEGRKSFTGRMISRRSLEGEKDSSTDKGKEGLAGRGKHRNVIPMDT